MREYRCISADAHWQATPDVYAQRVPAKYRDQLPKRIKLPNGADALQEADGSVSYGGTGWYSGHTPQDYDPRTVYYDTEVGNGPPEQRLEELDQDGVDAELIFHGGSNLGRFKDDALAAACLRAYNDCLAEEYCAVAPDRLLGVGYLLNRGVERDIREMERCAKLGLPAVVLTNYPSGKKYPTTEDDAFWAAALDLDMPVVIHTSLAGTMAGSGHGAGRGALKVPVKAEAEGYDVPPIDIIERLAMWGSRHCGSTDCAELIVTGVFDRFPRLKIYWAENQINWIPGYVEQMDTMYLRNRHWMDRVYDLAPLRRRPSEYVKEHAYWGFFDDPFGVQAARHYVGVDHILWGSDFPHEVSHWPRSQEVLEQQFAGVPEDEKRKMLCDNAVEFFHLDRSV